MKKILMLAALLCLMIPAALAQEIPREVLTLCDDAFPGYAVRAWAGHGGDYGQWIVVLSREGDNALCVAERMDGSPYRLTVANPNAVPDEGQAGFDEGMTVGVAFDDDFPLEGRMSRLKLTIAQPGAAEWEITASIMEDGETWGDVISEYVFLRRDGREEWFSHVFPEFDGQGRPNGYAISYMCHGATIEGRPLRTDTYPRVSVSGASADGVYLQRFDAGAYPYHPELLDGAQRGDYAQSFLPEGYALRQMDLQQRALILLVENGAGEHRLLIYPHENNQYKTAILTGILPKDAHLDTFHAGEDAIFLDWPGEYTMSFLHEETGVWRASVLVKGEPIARFLKNGIQDLSQETSSERNDGVYYGRHPWKYIEDVDFAALPGTFGEVLAQLDQRDYAVVNNPNPADRLHLRERPRKDARSFGKFYNRTPVRVFSIDGEWAHVSIGGESGYMMTKFLAFGEEMAGVKCAFPELILREGEKPTLLRDYAGKGLAAQIDPQTRYYVVGMTSDEERYILLTGEGVLGYLDAEALYPGNG